MTTPASAASAYASLARIGDPTAAPTPGLGGDDAGLNFGAMLKDAIGAVTQSARNSDVQTNAVAAGKANMVDVVTAVAETETTVQALVSVRDKVIAAYEDILKMPI